MTNKKTFFELIYAFSLVGAILSCIGFLNEFLNVLQLYKVSNDYLPSAGNRYRIIFAFYLGAFIISAFVVTILILHKSNKLKSTVVANATIISGSVVMLVMSMVLIYMLRYWYEYIGIHGGTYKLSSSSYLPYYTFRSGVMSFIAYIGIILSCDLIQSRAAKKADAAATVEEKVQEIDEQK